MKDMDILKSIAIPLLRWSLGIVYMWFGVLKIVGRSPAADMVAKALEPLPAETSVPLIGVIETVIGLGLLTRTALAATLTLFFMQVAGTFTIVVRRPSKAFRDGNPLLLTQEGEFLLKNLILLSAGLVVATRAGEPDERIED